MILTSDLHLTDRDRDEYRWKLFPFLKKKQGPTETLGILGDLTDAKDGHSSRLVNRVIDALLDLPGPVFCLMGNHDYIEKECPFFRFLGRAEFGNKLRFISTAEMITERVLALPHTRDPIKHWEKLDLTAVNVILTHQTYNGADAGAHKLESSLSSTYWSDRGFKGKVYSGDVHVPQKIGDVTYVGCPYPVHFGDRFRPRILLNVSGKAKELSAVENLFVPSIKRLSLDLQDVEELKEWELRPGDQVKLRVHLPRSEFSRWAEHKSRLLAIASSLSVEVYGIELHEKKTTARKKSKDDKAKAPLVSDPKELLRAFCRVRGHDEAVEQTAIDLLPPTPK